MNTAKLVLNPEVATILETHENPINIKFIKVERKRMYEVYLKRVSNHHLDCHYDAKARRWIPVVEDGHKRMCTGFMKYEQEYVGREIISVDSNFRTCQYKYPHNVHKYPNDKDHYFSYHQYHPDYDIEHLLNDLYEHGVSMPYGAYKYSIPEYIDANEYAYYGLHEKIDLIVCNECTETTPWPLFVPKKYKQKPIAVMFVPNRDRHEQWTEMELSISEATSFEW